LEMSVQEFLNSVSNPRTRKGYRFGLNKFVEWFGKTAEDALAMRQEDLTQKPGENLVEYKNRAARFEKEIERFHSYLIEEGYSINSARNMTLGIRQLFRYYQMPVAMRSGSRVSQTVQTTKNFPLAIEHVRRMFEVANLKERTVLSVAVDTGLRISDFLAIKITDLPPLDKEPPVGFELLTQKEKIPAHCFLSEESVDLLKTYLPTLQKKNNAYLFASNGKSHISDEAISKMLKRLAERAQIDLNEKRLSFHCFRKMFLSASIDSGIGLTAGKLLCGKAVAKSDATYLTMVKLREKFIQLKRFLSISEQPRIEAEKLESLKKAISKLQEDLTVQKTITETVSEENIKLKVEMEALSKGQGDLEKRMDVMTTMFRETFADLVETSVETIDAYAEKLKKKRDRKKGKTQTKPKK
jgi:site-specific recombinase XerD